MGPVSTKIHKEDLSFSSFLQVVRRPAKIPCGERSREANIKGKLEKGKKATAGLRAFFA